MAPNCDLFSALEVRFLSAEVSLHLEFWVPFRGYINARVLRDMVATAAAAGGGGFLVAG